MVVPAALFAALVTNAGLAFWRKALLGTTAFPSPAELGRAPSGLLWPPWGAALGAAALAYHLRRPPAAARLGWPPGATRGGPQGAGVRTSA